MMFNKCSMTVPPLLKQLFVVTGAALNVVGHGCVHGFPAVLLSQLRRPANTTLSGDIRVHGNETNEKSFAFDEDVFTISDSDASWITSVVGISLLFGTITAPFVMNKYGRKVAHQIGTLPIIAGWVLITFAQNTWTLIIARLLQGYAIGLRAPVAAIIIAEYTSPRFRGMFLGTIALSLATGMFLSHVIGTVLSWRMTSLACLSFSVIALTFISMSPESPSWLASKGRFEETVKSFRWLRGDSEERELEILINSQKSELEKRAGKSAKGVNCTEIVHIFKKKDFYKPLIVSYCLFTIFEFGGTHIVPAYAYEIMKAIIPKGNDFKLAVNWIDIVRVLAATFSFVLVKYFKRRLVLFGSLCSTVTLYVSISLYLILQKYEILTITSNLLPTGLFMMYIFSLTSGIVPMTWTLNGEIFPLTYKTLGSTLSCLFFSINYFISLKTAPVLFKMIGVEGAYILYAAIVSACGSVIYLLLPETKGKILQEIECEFRGFNIEDIELNENTERPHRGIRED